MFDKALCGQRAAELIERFLSDENLYPQEWNDFVENRETNPEVEAVRLRCYTLDPLVNCPGTPDGQAVLELQAMVEKLKAK